MQPLLTLILSRGPVAQYSSFARFPDQTVQISFERFSVPFDPPPTKSLPHSKNETKTVITLENYSAA